MDFETEIVALKETVQQQHLLLQELRASLKLSVPIGTIVPFSGKQDSPSLGWFLPADGSVVPPDERYERLRAVLADTFRHPEDPPNTCRLPDLRGRAPIGSGRCAGLEDRALGQVIGEEAHVLALGEMPSHNHGGSTLTDSPDHTHRYQIGKGSSWGGGEGALVSFGGNDPTETGGASARHKHSIEAQGEGQAHNNMQPSLVVRYLVKAMEQPG